jgi:hypothetical protein
LQVFNNAEFVYIPVVKQTQDKLKDNIFSLKTTNWPELKSINKQKSGQQ